jgi:hypothetical protein
MNIIPWDRINVRLVHSDNKYMGDNQRYRIREGDRGSQKVREVKRTRNSMDNGLRTAALGGKAELCMLAAWCIDNGSRAWLRILPA